MVAQLIEFHPDRFFRRQALVPVAFLRDELLASSVDRYVPYVGLAIANASLGEMDEAFQWLEKDVADRSLYPPFYGVDPVFDDMRGDPRFDEVLGVVASEVGAVDS